MQPSSNRRPDIAPRNEPQGEPTAASRSIRHWLRAGRAAVGDALAGVELAQAWELLQVRNAEGQVQGSAPYTPAALAALAAVYRRNDVIELIHHLAIGHHAYAWDLELRNDPAAAAEWEAALGHWRTLVGSAEFWAALAAKLQACDATADAAFLTGLRRDLLEHLLDIHVDFVRHYCEANAPERAVVHVKIVRRASIPPALKRRLIDKIFAAMIGAVPEALEQHAYATALATVEGFLALFPEHLPALRQCLEICEKWVASLSYLDDWPTILSAAARAEPLARKLVAHPDVRDDALAKAAVEGLGVQLVGRGHDRGSRYFAARLSDPSDAAERDAAKSAFELAIPWGWLCHPLSPSGSPLHRRLSSCLNSHALLLGQEVNAVMESDASLRTKLRAAARLCRRAVNEFEESDRLDPHDAIVERNLVLAREELATVERLQLELDLHDPEDEA